MTFGFAGQSRGGQGQSKRASGVSIASTSAKPDKPGQRRPGRVAAAAAAIRRLYLRRLELVHQAGQEIADLNVLHGKAMDTAMRFVGWRPPIIEHRHVPDLYRTRELGQHAAPGGTNRQLREFALSSQP